MNREDLKEQRKKDRYKNKSYNNAIEFLEYIYESLEIQIIEDDCGPLRFLPSTTRIRQEIKDYLEGNHEANSA